MNCQSKRNKKQQLINLYGSTCCWCGKTLKHNEITIEHLLPKNLGGSNAIANLLLACFACNNSRGSRLLPEKYALESIASQRIITCLKINQNLKQ